MAFSENHTQLFKYLDKRYIIKEKKFFRKYDDVHEWGNDLIDAFVSIFSFDRDFCQETLQTWTNNKGLTKNEYEDTLGPRRLTVGTRKIKVEWSPDLAQDLQTLHGIQDAEEHLINVLSDQIASEIDAQILIDLKGKIKSGDDFINLVKCVGYEPFDVMCGDTFTPKKQFMSMNYNDIKNERQNNSHWQDWVRAREQDKKT